jgi:tetratricopeptide (TPR) repeat protein
MRPLVRTFSTIGLVLGLLLLPALLGAQVDAERLRSAKTLYFDKKYAEAREAWTAIRSAGGADAEPAGYWIARCSESLGEHERALGEYGAYLDRKPADRVLAEEARTSRVSLATRLYKAGRRQHLPVLQQAVQSDPSKTVRYYAALQLASLGPEVGQPAVPVLKRILAEEKDEDLVDRARLALLKVDPKSLGAPSGAPRATGAQATGQEARWVRVRIHDKGKAEPSVSINLPVALAELVFKSLPDDARRELKQKGYDADNFWERLKKLGPTEIVEIVGDEGQRIRIWIE